MSKGASSSLVEVCNLEKSYQQGSVTLPVLRDVSLRIDEGAFVAITGASGSGKTTLLHLLAGLDVPTRGDVLWEGESILRFSDSRRAKMRNRMVGIVFQLYYLLPELSAIENVMLPGLISGRRPDGSLHKRAKSCLEQVGLSKRLQHRPQELSGGEQQRVAIARALVNEPKILYCDEPTGNLDSDTGKAIADLLTEINKRAKMSLVLVTHEASLAKLSDTQIVLRDGRIV